MNQKWDQRFMEIAKLVSTWHTCPRAAVGAVLVKDKRVLTTAHNGAPSGEPHCDEIGCLLEDGHCVRVTHSEQNIISFAAKYGIAIEGSTLYCTHSPCKICFKMLKNAGIKRIVIQQFYRDFGIKTSCEESMIDFDVM